MNLVSSIPGTDEIDTTGKDARFKAPKKEPESCQSLLNTMRSEFNQCHTQFWTNPMPMITKPHAVMRKVIVFQTPNRTRAMLDGSSKIVYPGKKRRRQME